VTIILLFFVCAQMRACLDATAKEKESVEKDAVNLHFRLFINLVCYRDSISGVNKLYYVEPVCVEMDMSF